jgi:hypothetical protein
MTSGTRHQDLRRSAEAITLLTVRNKTVLGMVYPAISPDGSPDLPRISLSGFSAITFHTQKLP